MLIKSALSIYNCRVCGEQKCGCKRHDNQTFLFITVGSVENRNVEAKDMIINQTFLFITVGCVENRNVDANDTTIRPFCL